MSAEWKTVLGSLLATLRAAQSQRDQRDDWVTVDGEQQLGWVFHERAAMLAETNEWRDYFGLPHVDSAMIARVERQAEGHSDYTIKYAIECAELAMGRNRLERTCQT